jgi:hypothetical protein
MAADRPRGGTLLDACRPGHFSRKSTTRRRSRTLATFENLTLARAWNIFVSFQAMTFLMHRAGFPMYL